MTSSPLPAADFFNDPARTNGEAKDGQDAILAFLRQAMPGASAETTLTIASGAVTPTGGIHAINTESSAASDDLTNALVTNMEDAQWLVLRAVNSGRLVTVKHSAGGSGQFNMKNGLDTTLDATDKFIIFRLNGTTWDEIMRNYDDRPVVSKSADYTVIAKDDGYVIKVDASGGAKVITMTLAATLRGNHRVTVEKSDTSLNTVTLARTSSDTFGGSATSIVLSRANQSVSLACDGVSDFRITAKADPGLDVFCGSSGGTANAMTFTPLEPVRALWTGLKVRGWVTTANTSGTMTLAISGLTAKSVKKRLGAASVAIGVGENAGYQEYVYDGTDLIMLVPRADAQAANIASSSTLNFDTATGNWGHITGTTTVTAITLAQGTRFRAIFDGILTLTNGASLINLSGANIVTAAGDSAEFVGEASGVVRMVAYSRASGASLVAIDPYPAAVTGVHAANVTTFTVDFTTYSSYDIIVEGEDGGNSSNYVTVDVSSNGGSSYASATRTGASIDSGGPSAQFEGPRPTLNGELASFDQKVTLVGTLIQYSATGETVLKYTAQSEGNSASYATTNGVTRYGTSAAVNRVALRTSSGTPGGGNVILQPKSKR